MLQRVYPRVTLGVGGDGFHIRQAFFSRLIKSSFPLAFLPSFLLSFPLSFSFFPVLEKCGKVTNICQPISFSFGAVLVSYVLSVWHPLMLSSHYKSTQQEKMSFFFFFPLLIQMFTLTYLLNTFLCFIVSKSVGSISSSQSLIGTIFPVPTQDLDNCPFLKQLFLFVCLFDKRESRGVSGLPGITQEVSGIRRETDHARSLALGHPIQF